MRKRKQGTPAEQSPVEKHYAMKVVVALKRTMIYACHLIAQHILQGTIKPGVQGPRPSADELAKRIWQAVADSEAFQAEIARIEALKLEDYVCFKFGCILPTGATISLPNGASLSILPLPMYRQPMKMHHQAIHGYYRTVVFEHTQDGGE